MPSYSYFHSYYSEHSEELKRELLDPMMDIERFTKKYRIGKNIYCKYFAGLKPRYRSDKGVVLIKPEDRIDGVKMSDSEVYIKRKESIAEKLGVTVTLVQSYVNQGYTLSEIENGKVKNGRIIPANLYILSME